MNYDPQIDWRAIMKLKYITNDDFNSNFILQLFSEAFRFGFTKDSFYFIIEKANKQIISVGDEEIVERFSFPKNKYPYTAFDFIQIDTKLLALDNNNNMLTLEGNNYLIDYNHKLYYLNPPNSIYISKNQAVHINYKKIYLTRNYMIVVQDYKIIVYELIKLPILKPIFELDDYFNKCLVLYNGKFIAVISSDKIRLYNIRANKIDYEMTYKNVSFWLLLNNGQLIACSNQNYYLNNPIFNLWSKIDFKLPANELILHIESHIYINKLLIISAIHETRKLYLVNY